MRNEKMNQLRESQQSLIFLEYELPLALKPLF